jgi:hypothetical protein
MHSIIALLLIFQQGANTSPASGDTVGYWQQRASYRIVATLQERDATLHGVADLTYVNNSPDTLREMYVHQYLNAFRPGSRWSEVDRREGRVRFQNLRDPDYGFERFTTAPTFDGRPVPAEYPGAPDSTVAHFKLPRGLAPHDSMRVHFEWNARTSTTLRRQGRKGRSYDFAQWYPKVAVYDRGGWEPNPLVPAGELYGEFGTYDVTLVVPADEVIGATGVPVSGDPGWEAVERGGTLRIPTGAYRDVPAGPEVTSLPPGDKVVRFYARDVHHFAWSMSPDYRFEGGVYVRRLPSAHYPVWDTVSINVLYRPGDDSTWGGGRAVQRTIQAFEWLERIWGPYAWPTFTNLHRLENGGTEFPMMIMDGSADLPLILHELGHNFTYGILANNEWRSGWMDEGLTSYQTSWALRRTPQEVALTGPPLAAPLARGYRVNATTMTSEESRATADLRLSLSGHTQPVGTPGQEFRDFGTYNAMVYGRAEIMYGQLRDVLGDSTFARFLHDYYSRWALKHVDERAMRASAERASGTSLGWFFDEWVHHVGLTDYALRGATTSKQPDGTWLTRATIERRGGYSHPMLVGVRTTSGWTFGRGDEKASVQVVEIVSAGQPLEVRIDPLHFTADWDRRNDVAGGAWFGLGGAQTVYDWPFLDQASRDRALLALSPMAWYSDPGALTIGLRARSNYMGLVDKYDFGLAVTTDSRAALPGPSPHGVSRLQGWWRFENPYMGLATHPLIGVAGGAALLDGVAKLDLAKTWDLSPFYQARALQVAATVGVTGAYVYDKAMLPEGWDDRSLTQAWGDVVARVPTSPFADSGSTTYRVSAAAGGLARQGSGGYSRGELEATSVGYFVDGYEALIVHGYAAASNDPPSQAALHLSSADPLSTFDDDWYRPRGAILKRPGVNFLPFGGAGLRGYDPSITVRRIAAASVELAQRVTVADSTTVRGRLGLWFSAFGDFGLASSTTGQLDGGFLADAGVGLSVRGRLYDRAVTLRLDAPLIVHQPGLAGGGGLTRSHADIAARWVFSVRDLW